MFDNLVHIYAMDRLVAGLLTSTAIEIRNPYFEDKLNKLKYLQGHICWVEADTE